MPLEPYQQNPASLYLNLLGFCSSGLGRIRFLLLSAVLLLLLSGCETMSYYGQAASGQLSLIAKRKSIRSILASPDTPEELAGQLRLVLRLRDFAEERLSLPAGGNYLGYVALESPYVVWNVYAAPELSLSPVTWCYPFVGCMGYRGYFSQKSARRYAEKLEGEGRDVFMAGVAAYSTLGWFDDPVLSTFVHDEEADLAGLLFHELAHRLLYVKDDSTFNESFATAVALFGVRRWMENEGKGPAYDRFLEHYRRRQQFVRLVMNCRERLEKLYAKPIPPEEKRDGKAAAITALKEDYEALKRSWGGYGGYDGWFERPLNNAQLNTVSTYFELVPALFRLLDGCGGDLSCFYEKCRVLSEKTRGERDLLLDKGSE